MIRLPFLALAAVYAVGLALQAVEYAQLVRVAPPEFIALGLLP
jgi:hypothetical protein